LTDPTRDGWYWVILGNKDHVLLAWRNNVWNVPTCIPNFVDLIGNKIESYEFFNAFVIGDI